MKRLDFLEIGTSDFDTLIELAGPDSIGVSVEPVKYYYDRLPDKSGVKKLNVAISDKRGSGKIYYIPPDTIKELGLFKDYRGCNCLNTPHPTVVQSLLNLGYNPDEFFVEEDVCILKYSDLVALCGFSEVKYCKIDTEGHDCKVIKSILDYGDVLPERIKFESNTLSKTKEIAATILRLKHSGYKVIEQSRTDTTVQFCI